MTTEPNVPQPYQFWNREDYAGCALGFSLKREGQYQDEMLIGVSEAGIFINTERTALHSGAQAELVDVMRECVAAFDALKRAGRTPRADYLAWAWASQSSGAS